MKQNSIYEIAFSFPGGWLLIGNMSFSDTSQVPEMFNNVVNGNGQISSLSEATKGRFLISDEFEILRTLFEYTGFKELRIRCFKPWHGRTIHSIMKGDWVVKRMSEGEHSYGLCASNGKEVRFLHDDTSLMKTFDCASFRTGSPNMNKLYANTFWINAETHVMLVSQNRFDCDDHPHEEGYQLTGNWQFHVR